MNPDKTKLLVIGVRQLLRQLPDFTITLCGKPISSTPVAKDLGVFLDQCLSYDEHIRKTVASCINKLIQINRIKHLHDKETLSLIINTFVFSRLFYCSSDWSNTSATNIHKLQLVQNLQPRLSWDSANMTISAGLRSLRWLNVKQRLMVNDAVMMHKCLKGLSPSYLSDNLVPRVLSYPPYGARAGRREPWERGCLSDKFSTRAIVHDRQTRCICYRGVKIWNNCCRSERA